MQHHSVKYTLLFSAAVCGVCAIFVSTSAVTLEERQTTNELLEKQKNVLEAAGLKAADEKLPAAEIEERFATIEAVVINLESGEELADVEPAGFDQQKAKRDPDTSRVAPDNPSRIQRLPHQALVYKKRGGGGELDMVILPIEGYGLWGTLFGFLALDADLETVRGITYYQHKETAGLGGEVDNSSWKALWPGRKAFGPNGEIEIEVIKGRAGKPAEDPHRVDGLSGATITGRGVTNMIHFWLGESGFGPYLDTIRQQGG